jgi:hypothetical protein
MNDDLALKIYLSLLSRDPLPQQRFTELGERFEQLAHLAHSAAEQFESVKDIWERDRNAALTHAADRWDVRSVVPEPLLKKKVMVGQDAEFKLPKSQGDLLGEKK